MTRLNCKLSHLIAPTALWAITVFCTPAAWSQSAALSFAPATTSPGGIATKDILLNSSGNVAVGVLEWTIYYPAGEISALSVTAGPALTNAGKTLNCIDTRGAYTCIVAGLRPAPVASGVIATLHATPVGNSANSTLSIANALAVASDGTVIPVTASGAGLSLPAMTLTGLSCGSSSFVSGASVLCSVNFNFPVTAAGQNMTVATSTPLLTAQATIPLQPGATAQTFTVNAGAISTSGVGTITVAAAGSSKTVSVALNSVAAVSGVQCAEATLFNGGSTLCTVTLTKAAGKTGTSVTLSTNVPALSAPASVLIPSGTTSATFTLSAANIAATQAATVSATLAGMTRTTGVSLETMKLSALNCVAAYLSPRGSTQCTVMMNTPAKVPTSVTLSSGSATLTVPALVTVPAGSSSAAFVAQAGTFTASQNVAVKATYNGSTAAASVSLSTYANLSSIACNPPSVAPSSSGTCTVSLSAPAANSTVRLVATAGLQFPATLVIPTGKTSANVAFTVSANPAQPMALTGTLGASTASFKFTLGTASLNIKLRCAPAGSATRSSTSCHVGVSEPAPAGGMTIMMTSSSKRVQTPASVFIAEHQTAADFTAEASLAAEDEVVVLRAVAPKAAAASSTLTVRGVRPTSLACAPRVVAPGEKTICVVHLSASDVPDAMVVNLTSDAKHLAVPASLATRGGQRTIRFEAQALPEALDGTARIQANFGRYSVEDEVAIVAAQPIRIAAPDSVSAKVGIALEVRVQATNSQNLPVSLGAAELPEGATFDASTGSLRWTPPSNSDGDHQMTFLAQDAVGHSVTKAVTLHVGIGTPVLERMRNAASEAPARSCSAGTLTAITGRWLVSGTAGSDTKLFVNGQGVPLLAVSPERLEFLCPRLTLGTTLDLVVSTTTGTSNHLAAVTAESTPALFTTDHTESGQALAVRGASRDLAALPNAHFDSKPLFTGDALTVYATGVPCQTGAAAQLKVGHAYATIDTLRPAGNPGVCEITASVPHVAGDRLALSLEVPQADGTVAISNHPSIAVDEQ